MSALAPEIFLGLQPRPNGKPPIALFNLTADIPDHARGSTVSRETLEAAGYLIPDSSAILESPFRADESPRLSHATVRCSQCGSASPFDSLEPDAPGESIHRIPLGAHLQRWRIDLSEQFLGGNRGGASYAEWVKARVALDMNTIERMLAPDFYFQLPDRKLTRQEFIVSSELLGQQRWQERPPIANW